MSENLEAIQANQTPPQISVINAEPEIFSERNGEELKLVLGEFAGPMDLLLYLIRQEQVSIYDLPLARITDEYLRYIQLMRGMDIAVAGEFLLMAATLIEIKSKMLLPRASSQDLVEDAASDPRHELVRQLLEHQKYKAASQMLWSRATVEQATFRRAPIETDKENPEVSAGVFDLLRVFQVILARRKEEVLLEIERDDMTMTQMFDRLREMVNTTRELSVTQFFERTRSRRELVLAFLSILELVRAGEISFTQSQTFGDITMRAVSSKQ
ncbi:MAG: segregation/condensation protein A [Pyrinomonadaceae bacterium MAG19_C2-C3]|nr:segregation/condensation protein A [Pyrinomonadaceae bacterium MAG19_C2-C3]